MRAHNGVCHICGQGAADAIDHIVPVAWGGSDDPSNLAPAHTSCNSAKGDARPAPWTYSRPSMWLPGYGPRAAAGATRRSQGVGCWAVGGVVLVALLVGGLVGGLVGSEWVTLGVTAAVAWALIRWLQKRGKSSSSGETGDAAADTAEPVTMTLADGTDLRNARGVASMGGMAADVPPEGADMVWLPVVIEGDNIETLIDLLGLAPGFTGYRDAILLVDGDRLVVHAMARLAADVAASGDDDTGAAPVGYVESAVWAAHPELGRGATFVQLAIEIDANAERSARIGFVGLDSR